MVLVLLSLCVRCLHIMTDGGGALTCCGEGECMTEALHCAFFNDCMCISLIA